MRKVLMALACCGTMLVVGCSSGGGNGGGECSVDNPTCPEGYRCNFSTNQCEEICNPQCEGKCGGDDGCGGTCPATCPAGQVCNTETNTCEACTPDCSGRECGPDPVCGESCGTCPAGEQCVDGQCQGCVPDCAGKECGDDGCGGSCGDCDTGMSCSNFQCVATPTGDCPPGQECTDLTGTGGMGCVEPGPQIPAGNQTDCAGSGCDGNFSCYCLDQNCSQSVCIENCGTCPSGTECCELWAGGPYGCLTTGCADIPPNPPYCDQTTPCPGNMGCYTDGTNNFCIGNCSTPACTENDTKCVGDVIYTCDANGEWQPGTDCSTSGQACYGGQCMTPVGIGEFCENAPCEADLDCIGTQESQHSFCAARCDCTDGTGCPDPWVCMFQSSGDPPTCWCGMPCDPANNGTDCPNGGNGWSCELLGQDDQGNDVYGCMIQ